MIERVKINSSEIIIKNADGNETFNTANRYIKTDPNGQIKAGGYAPCTVISGGYGSEYNQYQPVLVRDIGWYNCGKPISGANVGGSDSEAFGLPQVFNITKATVVKLIYNSRAYQESDLQARLYSPITQTALINGKNFGHTFKWGLVAGVYGPGYSLGPNFSSSLPIPESGTLTFPANTVTDFTQWGMVEDIRYNPNSGQIENQGYKYITQLPEWTQFPRTAVGGWMLTKRDPETLSLAISL
jgi:hypothetical protein